jgi:hypothetical protein
MLAAPIDKTSWIAVQIEKFGEGPIALLIGTNSFSASRQRLKLSAENTWFGRKLAWIDAAKLHGAHIGVIE